MNTRNQTNHCEAVICLLCSSGYSEIVLRNFWFYRCYVFASEVNGLPLGKTHRKASGEQEISCRYFFRFCIHTLCGQVKCRCSSAGGRNSPCAEFGYVGTFYRSLDKHGSIAIRSFGWLFVSMQIADGKFVNSGSRSNEADVSVIRAGRYRVGTCFFQIRSFFPVCVCCGTCSCLCGQL